MCVLHKQFGELRLFVFQMYIWSQNLVLAFAFVWCEPVWLHLVRSSSMGLKQFAKQKFQTLSIQLGLDCISASYIYIYIPYPGSLVSIRRSVVFCSSPRRVWLASSGQCRVTYPTRPVALTTGQKPCPSTTLR